MSTTLQSARNPAVIFSLFLVLAATSCSQNPAPAVVAESADGPGVETAPSQSPEAAPATPATGPTKIPADAIARIREEGLNHSQVMETLSYLSDVIGPRLTGSPNLKRANEWTRDKLASWGLANAHMEAWGPFGRGWSLKRFSAQVVEPQDIPLIAFPKAWSPGFEKPITADVIYIEAKTEKDLEKYKGKLKGAIVLYSAPREVQQRFDPLALRVADAELLKLANSQGGEPPPPGIVRANTGSERRELLAPANANRELLAPVGTPGASPAPTTKPTTKPATQAARGPATRPFDLARVLPRFLAAEGAAMMVTPSSQGDGGTFFVAQTSVPTTQPFRRGGPPGPQPWSANAPAMLPQITAAVEHYNRLVRMIQAGEKLKMNVDLQVQYHTADPMAYNTIAEIPGSDLRDEIVMIGAHMDSWHSGTGATDNGAGVAATMEAVRIIKALKLQPRRTIRIGLWTGEEEGLLGSKAYVAKHFGKFEETTTRPSSAPVVRGYAYSGPALSSSTSSSADPTRVEVGATRPTSRPTTRPARKFIPGPEYDHLAGYFNLDNGAGKIRGVYLRDRAAWFSVYSGSSRILEPDASFESGCF
jgi:carboxypeptidase Q